MNQVRVGTRELKNKLSHYIRTVKKGQSIIVTERGMIVAQLIPPRQSLEERIWLMVDAGLADWNGKKLKPYKAKKIKRTKKSFSQLIIEDRR